MEEEIIAEGVVPLQTASLIIEEEIVAEGDIFSQTSTSNSIEEASFMRKKDKLIANCNEFVEQNWNFAGLFIIM